MVLRGVRRDAEHNTRDACGLGDLSFISSLAISGRRRKTYGKVLFGFSWRGGFYNAKFL
jgi:hypothetical protein